MFWNNAHRRLATSYLGISEGAGIGERHTPDLWAVVSGLCAAGEFPEGERVVGGDDPTSILNSCIIKIPSHS
jgi:hypothetical protein